MPKKPTPIPVPDKEISERILRSPTAAEGERVYADHLLTRYLRVAIRLDGDVIEVVPRRGHRISFAVAPVV